MTEAGHTPSAVIQADDIVSVGGKLGFATVFIDGKRYAAEDVVRAVNSHAAMFEALRKAHDYLDSHGDGWDEADTLRAIRAALSQATGKE